MCTRTRKAAWLSTMSASPMRSSPQCATTPNAIRKSTATWILAKLPIPNSWKSSPYAATRCSAMTTAPSSLPNLQPNVPTLSLVASITSSPPGTKTPPANLSNRRASCSRHMDLQKAVRPIRSAPRLAISKLFENSSSSSLNREVHSPAVRANLHSNRLTSASTPCSNRTSCIATA